MVVDEFSRFHFAFSCKDTSNETVKKCLLRLFSLFGMAKYMHCDRGSSLISDESRKARQVFWYKGETAKEEGQSVSKKNYVIWFLGSVFI